MKDGHVGPRIVVRAAAERDADCLARFRCSTGPWYEREVERFIRRRALEQALTMPESYRLLLAFDNDRLVCCMAHHVELLVSADSHLITPAVRLQLLAIAGADQGRKLDHGTRLSDMVMASLIADALKTRELEVVTAIVALDNLRSMALCKRHHLRSQVQYDARHARPSGHFTPR